MPAGTPEMRAGSAAFHLEMAGVYQRYGDSKSAIEHFSQAVSLAQGPAQQVQAYAALARAKEASGDRDGAIEALELAVAKTSDPNGAAASMGAAVAMQFAGPLGDDVLLQLARLHAERGNYDRARALGERGLAGARGAWQREQLDRFMVDLDRKAGTLEQKIAAMEKTLDEGSADESALRFLAAALASDGMPAPGVMGAPPAQPPATSKTLIRVYERLHELHPDDAQLRQNLLTLLERAGRIDEAAKLAISTPLTPMDCESVFSPRPPPAAVRGAAEAVRIRMLSADKKQTLTETAKIAALAKQEGVAAYLVAAQLYLEQGAAERSTRMLDQAARNARSRDDQRQVAVARERALERAGWAAELNAIHERWASSDDPCLRLAATMRKQPQGMLAAVPQPPPSPGR
jgi:tetratricopeptide (TPR) repeat protein